MRGEHHRAALLDDAEDGVPQGAPSFGVHPRGGLVLHRQTPTHTHRRSQHPPLREGRFSALPPREEGGTDQEDDGRPSDQSDGRGQLPHVAAAVAARRLVHVLDQAQLANAPLCHLVDGRRAGIKGGMGGGGG